RGVGEAPLIEVLDVALAATDRGDLRRVHVEAQHLEPALDERQRERKADVAEADDAHPHLARTDARDVLVLRRGRLVHATVAPPREAACQAPAIAALSPTLQSMTMLSPATTQMSCSGCLPETMAL